MYKLNSKRSILVLLITLILGAILCPSILFSFDAKTPAHALSYNNYVFKNYNVDINVTDKNEFVVEENFTVAYGDPEHGLHKGIVRVVPLDTSIDKTVNGETISIDYGLKYSNVDANELYDYYTKDGFLYIELGGDDYINMGEAIDKNYTVKYTLKLGDDYNDDYDFFFYNIIGVDHPVKTLGLTFNITLPYDFEGEPTFYQGKYASSDKVYVGLVKKVNEDGKVTLSGSYPQLNAYEALTIDLTLKEGYFEGLKEVIARRKAWDTAMIVVGCVIAVVILLYAIIFNNKKHRPVETVEFYPPDDTTPVDAAYLLNGRTTPQDMMSLVVYWASKGIAKIQLDENNEPEKVIKLQNITEQAPEYEKMLFNEMFQYTDTFSLKTRNNSLASTIQQCHTDVRAHNGDLKSNKSKISKFVMGILAVLPVILGVIIEATRAFEVEGVLVLEGLTLILLCSIFLIVEKLIFSFKRSKQLIFPLVFLVLFAVMLGFVGIFFPYCPIEVKITRYLPLIVFILSLKLLDEYDITVREKVGKLLGFRKNLKLVEEDKIKMLVDEDPEYFYNVLPYAYTLGIADDFIEKFANIGVYQNSNFGGVVTVLYMSSFNRSCRNFVLRNGGGSGSFSSGGGGGAGGGFGGGGSFGR